MINTLEHIWTADDDRLIMPPAALNACQRYSRPSPIPKRAIRAPTILLTAYVDESGFTGGDLLNADQPFMALSALLIGEDDAKELCAKHFAGVQAQELKHAALSRRQRYHPALLAAQRECLDKHGALSYIVDKRYMCVLKLLDDCVEPAWFANGLDFYANGSHIALASLLTVAAPAFWTKERFEKLLQLYQIAIRDKTDAAIGTLCEYAQTLTGLELGECLVPLAGKHPAVISEIRGEGSSDIAAPLMFGLLSKLEEYAAAKYQLVHDPSPGMKAYHGMLHILRNSPPQDFHISSLCRISYPLKLSSVREADSKHLRGLQLADLLAGGIVASTRPKPSLDAYGGDVLKLYSDHNLLHMIPNTDFADLKQQFAGSQISDAINYAAIQAASETNRKQEPPKV